MAFPTTLQDIKTYINGLPSFPVDRTTAVFYGLSDTKLPNQYVAFSGLDASPEYTTCGVAFYTGSFGVGVVASSMLAAVTLAGQVDALLNGQQVTPKMMSCLLGNYKVVPDDHYRYQVQLTYNYQENV